MSSVRNWTSGIVMAALILFGPIIAFVTFITGEMLTDLVTKVGATAVWPVAAGAVGWGLLRKFAGLAQTSQLRGRREPDRTSRGPPLRNSGAHAPGWGMGHLALLIAGAERRKKGPERSGPFRYRRESQP